MEALVRTATVLNIDERIGYDFAAIKSTLASTNQLIPDNDIWIAVTAMAYDLTLVTRDAHFSRIAAYGLVVDQW